MSGTGLVAVGAGLSQVALALILLSGRSLAGLSRRLFALLMLGVGGYLMLPFDTQLGWLFSALSTAVPGLFWLFCASLFDDHYEFPLWQPLLVLASVILPLAFELGGWPAEGLARMLLRDVPQLLEFVFLLLALWAIFANWRDDLVPERRTLRFWFCAGAGVFIFLLILSREVLFSGAEWLEEAQYLATALVLLGLNALLLRFPEGSFEPIQRDESHGPAALKPVDDGPEVQKDAVEAPSPAASGPPLDDQLAPVRRLVEEEGLYREHGMTIGRLAAAAGLPEYRLRQLINGGLGYRNFNDFLNRFRIEEASRRLGDPSEARLPVLTIALDVGFRSISSFNKCFKDTHGITPTAYRKARLTGGDSAGSDDFSVESAEKPS